MSKRSAESELTQHNWEDQEDGSEPTDQEEFSRAPPEEIAKRRIVKARRGGGAAAVASNEAASAEADKTDKPAAPAPFAWSSAKTPAATTAEEEDKKDANTTETAPAREVGDKEKEAPAGDSPAPAEKKPLFAFSAFGTGGGFGSGSAPAFSFSTSGAAGTGAVKPFTFQTGSTNGFSFGSGTMASFASVGTQGWNSSATQKKDGDKDQGDEDAKEGEGDDDAESEVAVRKGDGVVQLEEVETCTGEENERCVFQVRAKLFTYGKPSNTEGGEGEKEPAVDPKGKEAGCCWNVTGIGNLKINIPKSEDQGARPRIIMRRQKTFQVCLNTYLFESMLCDKAGPKDVRFTGMKSDGKEELATFLLRVKEEEQADEFVAMVKKYKPSQAE